MKYIYRVHNLNIDSSGSKGSHVLYTSLVHAHQGIMIPRVAHITLEHFIVGVRAETRAVYIVITVLENLSGLLRLFSSFDFGNLLS